MAPSISVFCFSPRMNYNKRSHPRSLPQYWSWVTASGRDTINPDPGSQPRSQGLPLLCPFPFPSDQNEHALAKCTTSFRRLQHAVPGLDALTRTGNRTTGVSAFLQATHLVSG